MDSGQKDQELFEKQAEPQAPSRQISAHAFPDGPQSLTGLFRWITIGSIAYILVEVLSAMSSGFLIWLYLPSTIVPFDLQTLETIDLFIIGITVAQIAILLTCAILIARCTFRAMRNLYTVGSDIAEMSPGWAVGWYFVPIASLFKPAEGMSQIVHGTRKAIGEKPFVTTAIPLWWTSWILMNITSTIAGQFVDIDGDSSVQITGFSFDAASSVLGILSAWALLRVLSPVVHKQEMFKYGGAAHVFD